MFIDATKRHYGFDFCPAFWKWLEEKHADGTICSIDKVLDEVIGAGDDLAVWAQARGEAFFRKPHPGLLPALARVSAWAQAPRPDGKRYSASAISTFLSSADYYLIGHGLATGDTIVTYEGPAPDAIRSIKIPDACLGVGVKWMTPYAMLRRERAKFVLGGR